MSHFVRQALDALWRVISGVSVRVKILGLALGLVFGLGFGIIRQVQNSLSFILSSQLQNQSIISARDLAARATDAILLNDLVDLQKLLIETQNNNPDLRYAFIVDADGQVLAHTFGAGFPLELLDRNRVAPNDHHHTVILNTTDGVIWDTAVPILQGKIGTARLGLSDSRLSDSVQNLTAQVLLMILFVSGIGVLVAVFLTFVLTRPIKELVDATQKVSQGDFSPRLSRWANDEFGDLAEAFNQMTVELARLDELRREREFLRRQLLEKVITAQEQERRRIARELHDSTSQNLTSLMVGLKNVHMLCNDPRLLSNLDELRRITAETLDEIHEISARLRPTLLDDLGLPDALKRLTRDWQALHKIPVDLVVHIGDERLTDEIETTIYRIVQEALTNIARHARARSVSVFVERRNQELIAIVEDNGLGFDVEQAIRSQRLGLLGMRERAELLGGKLTIESQPDKGSELHVRIPLETMEKINA